MSNSYTDIENTRPTDSTPGEVLPSSYQLIHAGLFDDHQFSIII